MRYLVRARLKSEMRAPLVDAIAHGTLGIGSIAGGEYLRNMACARQLQDGTVRWVEVCYCPTPLAEERLYWEEYFDLIKVQDAHAQTRCQDSMGEKPWSCNNCDCSKRLAAKLATTGTSFLDNLRQEDQP